ncbi:hypothetical protein [Brachybacterium hainanense]|uniref:Uncharacterized protein n=1 Tax=Brachybacterium hainanense TaxID=1541174 RepID=A0ABV6R7N3_9MICO
MWNIPENDLLRILPWAILAALCLWGLVSPRTQWTALWGWQRRYRAVDERDRPSFVRVRMILPLILCLVIGVPMALL